MISKELKRLSRKELVDIIYQLKKNEQEKQEEMAQLEEKLQEKRIRVSVAGSIAEAAMDITQIFATAQRTADLYLVEISNMKDETQRQCDAQLEAAKKKADGILAEAERQFIELAERYKEEYQKYQELKAKCRRLEERMAKRDGV